VLGKYTTTPEDKVRYDILYIKNYSILMDIKLIFQTLKIVFIKESSEGIKDELTLTQIMDDYNLEITVDREENKC
jgi:hypothetical protein